MYVCVCASVLFFVFFVCFWPFGLLWFMDLFFCTGYGVRYDNV